MTFRSKGTRSLLVVPDSRRVRLYHVDAVGNNLDRVLRWCDTHDQPVWVYDDGSFECPHDHTIAGCGATGRAPSDHRLDSPGDHLIVDGPWEIPIT